MTNCQSLLIESKFYHCYSSNINPKNAFLFLLSTFHGHNICHHRFYPNPSLVRTHCRLGMCVSSSLSWTSTYQLNGTIKLLRLIHRHFSFFVFRFFFLFSVFVFCFGEIYFPIVLCCAVGLAGEWVMWLGVVEMFGAFLTGKSKFVFIQTFRKSLSND